MPGPLQIFSMVGFSGILELVGGVLLAIGLFTRITAFILSGEMAVAYLRSFTALSSFISPRRVVDLGASTGSVIGANSDWSGATIESFGHR
jgi:uncharacterized membrane protein YphA (DoxX/SURF4 family)